MAIAFVNAGTGATVAHNQASLTYAANATGGSILIVGVFNSAVTGTINSVTYNGVAMTQAGQSPSGSGNIVSLWYLNAPATGSNNIVITPANSTQAIIESGFIVLSGTAISSPEGNGGKSTGTTTTAESTSVTTGTANSWIVDVFFDADTLSGNPFTPTSPSINRYAFSENVLSGQAIQGNTRTTTTAGAYTIAGTFNLNTSWASVAMEVKPAAGAAAQPAFLLNLI